MPDLLVIVGGGNMGAALLGGLLAREGTDPASFAVSEPLTARREELADRFPGVAIRADVPPCAAAVIAVKPGDVPTATAAAVAAGARRILSIAAGVPLAALEGDVVRNHPDSVRVNAMVVREETREDRGSRRTAERCRNEGVRVPTPAVREPVPRLRHHTHRPGTLVVRHDDEHVRLDSRPGVCGVHRRRGRARTRDDEGHGREHEKTQRPR